MEYIFMLDSLKPCRVRYGIRGELKEFPSDMIVVRDSFSSRSVVGIAEDIMDSIIDNLPFNQEVDIALPNFGGVVMNVQLPSGNFTSGMWKGFVMNMAMLMIEIGKDYVVDRFREDQELQRRMQYMEEARKCVLEYAGRNGNTAINLTPVTKRKDSIVADVALGSGVS